MGQVKAYAEWAKEEGYLDSNYMPVDPKAGSMDYVDKYGNISMPFNSEGMYRGFVKADGTRKVSIFK